MASVIVKNISGNTSDEEVQEFFKFCGNIADFSIVPDGDSKTKTATVTFEKDTAQKTALLLNNTQLGPNRLSVSSATAGGASAGAEDEHEHEHEHGGAVGVEAHSDEFSQEEKPRARILAEYLAHGYVIGDAALEHAIELDHRHGVTARFLSTLQTLDQKFHATEHARSADETYRVSHRASSLFSGLNSFFEKATNTPTGQKVARFYEGGSRRVQDIHAEARRLAELKKQAHGGSAYRAAGLERYFGPEKTGQSASVPGSSAPAPTDPSEKTQEA